MTIVHPEFEAQGSFAHLRLGKNEPKHDPRTLKLAKYVDRAAIPIPAAEDYTPAVAAWPMYGNDRLGDCTCAAVGHMIQAWSANVGTEKTFDEADIELLYWETGTPPSSSGEAGGDTDTGRFELDILNYWRKTGVGQPSYADKIVAFASIDVSDINMLKTAIFLFGGVYVGLALPKTAQGQAVWDVVGDGETGDSQPGSWGGHAVNVAGYGDGKLKLVTWGGVMEMTENFWHAYGDEAYAIVTADWIRASGESVSGFDLATLQQDLAQVGTPQAESAEAPAENGDEPRQTAPVLPWEIYLPNARVWLQKLPNGGMMVKAAPSVNTPMGPAPLPPGVVLQFDADAWDGFKRYVEADGEVTQVQTAAVVPTPPPGFLRR